MEIIESAGRAPSLKLYPGICLTTEGKARLVTRMTFGEESRS